MGQIARGTDRTLLARVEARLALVVPAGARESGRGIDVYRTSPDVFVAHAFIRWTTARGKNDSFRVEGSGRGPDAPNQALAALLAHIDAPPAPPTRRTSKPAEPPSTRAPKRSRATERGMTSTARRLLAYLVPAGATGVVRSVTVSPTPERKTCEARGSVSWKTPTGRTRTRVVTATGDGPEPYGVALARLLAKLERTPLVPRRAGGTPRR